jgi:tetratricopeptide (TPR) repeat protein
MSCWTTPTGSSRGRGPATRVRGWVVLAVLVWVGLLLAASAEARRRSKGPAAQAFAKGTELFKEKDYLGAIEAYEEAYRLKPHFAVFCNIGRCHERLNDMVKAAEYFRRCLDEGAAGVRRLAEKIRASLQRVEARISWVTVTSPGRGGTVYLDGVEIGPAPKRVALNPGTRVLEVRRQGASPARATLRTGGGESRSVELVPRVRALPRAAPPPVQPPARRASPGQDSAPRRSRGLSQAWFWTGAAVTVGCTIAAGVLGYQALQRRDDYEENPTRDGYNAAKDRRLLANIFWGAAAAAGVTSTVLFFFTDFRGRDRGPRSAAWGIGLRGSF